MIRRSWQGALLLRVVANASAGAIACALVGMLCGGGVGALADWINYEVNVAHRLPTSLYADPHFNASIGILGGLWIGLPLGAVIFAIAAVRAKPGRFFEPVTALIGRVMFGQIAGAIGFCLSSMAVEWARAAQGSKSFYIVALLDFPWLFAGAPALMICGAMAGAMSRRALRVGDE